ncbi:MAG: addiction module antidote protein, HigA family [Betaproteobacteria bacterium RIFCSPLOWO2_02_FULL_62_17]|nr:MAG: addiction module antidote protein, HigA family [Betaproteobacteria bacterium RIFCSPLOWO2_02_FULL_62_17]
MAKKLLPPIHPGEILREEFMKPLGLSANALAQRLGVTAARVNEIANEQRGITADTALRLGRCLSTTPEFWMNLQQRYELEVARREVGVAVEREVAVLALVAENAHAGHA